MFIPTTRSEYKINKGKFYLRLLCPFSPSQITKVALNLNAGSPSLARTNIPRSLYLNRVLNNLADSLYIARKRILAWYPHQIVRRRARVKPHPHLGRQRRQRLDAVQKQQVYKDKLGSAATYIYFKHHEILITPLCRPSVPSKTPHPSRSAAASGPAGPASQRSSTSPVSTRMQPLQPSSSLRP